MTRVLVRKYPAYMEPNLRAVVAARVSHLQDDGKTSHVSQNTTGTNYATGRDWTIVGEVEDLNVSAIKLGPWERPDLSKWLTDRVAEFDVLIFSKTDRVFRKAMDALKLCQWAEDNRKILVLVDDSIVIDFHTPEDKQDPMTVMLSRMFLFMASFFAEMEGRRFVQRAKDRVSALRHTDRWSHSSPKFGFKIVDHPSGEGKQLAHDDWPQEVLHYAAQRVLAGWAPNRISKEFNHEGVYTHRDWLLIQKAKPIQGYEWTPQTVRNLLTSPATQGLKMGPKNRPLIDANGDVIRVGPASFDDVTWSQLQATISSRAYGTPLNKNGPNPLLDIAKCGICGRNLRFRNQAKGTNGKKYTYYLCETCPANSGIPEDMQKLVYDEFIAEFAHKKILVRKWIEGSDVSSELAQTLLTIENLREDRALGLFTTPEDQAVFRNQMTSLIAKRDQLSAMPITKPGWALVESDDTYGEVWDQAGTAYRRELLIAAKVFIKLHPGRVYEVYRDLDSDLNEEETPEETLAKVLKDQESARAELGIPG